MGIIVHFNYVMYLLFISVFHLNTAVQMIIMAESRVSSVIEVCETE